MNLSLVGSAIKRLNVWEEQFKSWFDNIKLLGEIPLSASELEEICQDLRTAGSERVRRAVWPHTLVICMAAVAARNDERRYWGVPLLAARYARWCSEMAKRGASA